MRTPAAHRIDSRAFGASVGVVVPDRIIMWGFNYVGSIPSSIQKSVLRLVIKLFLGGFVDAELLDVENFVVFGNEISLSISNVQIQKERLQKIKSMGVQAKSGLVENLKFSIAWKDIFSGALSIVVDGIHIDLELIPGEDGLEKSIWYDALSESVHETITSLTDLERVLDAGVAELISSEEEELAKSISSDGTEESDMMRTIIKAMVRDISVEATNIEAKLQIPQRGTAVAKIGRVVLLDETEDIKAAEVGTDDPSKQIYIAKTFQMFGFEVNLISTNGGIWPFVRISPETEGDSCLDFSTKLYKDRNCEIEGWADQIELFVSPDYVDFASDLFSFASRQKPTVQADDEHRSILKFGFIKVEIGNLSLLMTDKPYTEADCFGLKTVLVDSIMTRFDSNSHAVPTTLTCSEYKITKLNCGEETIMCESHRVDSIKIIVDRGNLQLQVSDQIAVTVDQKLICLLRTFQRSFDRKHKTKQSTDDGEPQAAMPIVAQLSSLLINFDADLFPDCPGASLFIEGVLATTCGGASSLSLQSAELSFNDSSISLDPTTLTRKLNFDTVEGPTSLSPFDEMYTMIEEERFLNAAKTEKMQELQEVLQISVYQSVTVSCRGVKVSVSTEDLLSLKAASKLIRKPTGLEQPERKPSKCFKAICALIDLELKFPDSTRKLILADAVGFVCKGMKVNPTQKIFDFRSDLVSYSRDSQLLLRRILNLSLDNSFKNIVVATRFGDGEGDLVAQISGLECKLPLKITFDEEKTLMAKLVTSSDTTNDAPHMNTFVSLYKCSLTPEFPKAWPRCFPSALFADNIRAVLKSPEELKCFISDGILFLARRHKTPPIPGIYEKGMTYWRDHGYAPVCRLDFLKMVVKRSSSGTAEPIYVDLENQTVEVEVREDSAHIAKHFFDYISNMGRYDAVIEASKQPIDVKKPTDAQPCLKKDLQDIDEFMFAQSLSPTTHEAKKIIEEGLVDVEEDFFKMKPSDEEDEEAVEGVFASISPETQWEASLEVPTSISHGEETLVVGSEDTPALIFGQESSPVDVIRTMEGISELEIDEDYFAKPLNPRDTFPFSSKSTLENLTLRTRLHDFTVKIVLVEGSHFKATSDIPSRFQQQHHYVGSPLSPSGSGTPSVLKSFKSSYRDDFSKHSSPSSYSKWSALPPIPAKVQGKPDSVLLSLERINCEADWVESEDIGSNLSALRLAIPNIEVIDQVKKSRWKTVLARRLEKDEQTPLEDGSTFDTMLRCELSSVDADQDLKEPSSLEYRLKVRLLPLQIHLDQDTLVFLTKFASSHSKQSPPKEDSSEDDTGLSSAPLIEPLFFQHCDIGEISLRIDYKPKKLSFKNIRLGNFAEFVNFFQLEGAELKLPAASLRGVKGTDHFMAELMRAWLPFIKNTQVPQMVKGIAPVRTAINLGQGVSDLILLPMNEYTREGRVLRGLKKGAASFAHSTVLETARLGARLAAGTQVILEQVDDIFEGDDYDELGVLAPSKYQNQPENLQEGLVSAYQSMSSGLSQAMQTIIAVPIKVYERSGPQGAIKAVIRAVPIAVLKPVIGATEAVSKTLMGVENSLDPSRGIQIKRKYKQPDL